MIKKIYLSLINIPIIYIIKILVILKSKIRRVRKVEFEYFSKKYILYIVLAIFVTFY